MVFRTFFFSKSHPHFVMLNLRNIRVPLMITKFEYSHQSLGQEFYCEQVHKFPLGMALPPPHFFAVLCSCRVLWQSSKFLFKSKISKNKKSRFPKKAAIKTY
jgi:hypothetical protein